MPLCLVLGGGDKALAVVAGVVDLLQHGDDGLVGAAVQGSPEGANAGGGAGEKIGLAGGDHAHGGSGTILLVVGVKEEDQVQRPHHFGLQFVILIGIGKHHVEEIGGVFVVGLGIDEGQPAGFAVGKGGDGADLGNEAGGLLGRTAAGWAGRSSRDKSNWWH